MRLALISDIHANSYALEAVLADIGSQPIDQIICLGDLVGYAPFPNEVIEIIRSRKIACIQGNYDEAIGLDLPTCGCVYDDPHKEKLGIESVAWTAANTTNSNKQFLADLPTQLTLDIEGKRVLFVHGSPRSINEYLHYDAPDAAFMEAAANHLYDIVICGHTHVPYHRLVEGIHYVNGGSVGKPKHGNPNATYVILAVTRNAVTAEIREIAYNYEQTARAIERSELPNEFADLIRRGVS